MHSSNNAQNYFDVNNNLNKYKAHLFDLDGTLVASEKLKGKALAMTCSKYMKHDEQELDFNIYKAVMGESWEIVINHFFSIAKISPQHSEFNTTFRSIYEKLLHDEAELTAYAKEYILSLKKENRKIGIVSSAATWMVNQLLKQLDIASLFDVLIAREHVTKHKPDPEAYQLALSQLSMTCEEVLIYEDSWAGLTAANAAGCDAIAVRHDFNIENDLSLAMNVITAFDVNSIKTIGI